jgi:hypothetical protein
MSGVSTTEQYNRPVRRFETGDHAGAATLLAGIVDRAVWGPCFCWPVLTTTPIN